MPKKAGIAMIAMGAVLILSALLLLRHNLREDASAGQEAENLMAQLESILETQTAPTVFTGPTAETQPGQTTAPTQPLDPEMPVTYINGYGYIGYLEIPNLDLKLPVMADWDYDRLQIAPCRQFGSSRTDDLVIAAHNYDSHFGKFKDLTPGHYLTFTDMDGIVTTYRVEKNETLQPNAVDAVQNSDYDLVLYTCTKGGQTRIVLFCNRMDKIADKNEQPKSK